MNEASQQLLFFGLVLLGLYLLVFRPQRARARVLAEVRSAMVVGTRVVTTAGIHATVAAIEDDEVLLEVAPGVEVRFARMAVVAILEPGDRPADAPPDPVTPPADPATPPLSLKKPA